MYINIVLKKEEKLVDTPFEVSCNYPTPLSFYYFKNILLDLFLKLFKSWQLKKIINKYTCNSQIHYKKQNS